MPAPSILREILEHKRHEVAVARRLAPLAHLEAAIASAPAPRRFSAALAAAEGLAVIAECKRASPSRGPIAPAPWRPVEVAQHYQAGGAACLSVLTDTRYFWGQREDLVEVRAATDLPCLRKDFIVDPWQVFESRALGADAVLLIAAALEGGALGELLAACSEAGVEALLEVHDAEEAERAIAAGATLVGVNNRDLSTFEVDLDTTVRLAPRLRAAGCLVVGESGVSEPGEAARLAGAGVRAVLVGEALVRAEDAGALIAALKEAG